jgi:hypothetical protein
MELLVRFPPPKVHAEIKGTKFIVNADKYGTTVKLVTEPGYRKVQTAAAAQVAKSLGAVKAIPYYVAFGREGTTVNTLVIANGEHLSQDWEAPPYPFWFQSAPLLRVYLAAVHLAHQGLASKPTPRDVTDLAHLPWVLRQHAGVAPWKWGMNGSNIAIHTPVDAGLLTPVFTGATLWVVGKCRIRLKGV